MTVAIVGGYGQLGTALQRVLGERCVPLSRTDCDLLHFDHAEHSLEQLQPRVIVNCAAYNYVDKAEAEREPAFALNCEAPGRLAESCERRGMVLVHISTDYVFGRDNLGDESLRKPFDETTVPLPDSIYGASKLAGEKLVREHCGKHFVLRTCGLYGHRLAQGKGNFVETMLRLGAERDELKVVNDQRCTPTSAADLAEAIAEMLETDAYGLYHATNSGETTWFDFAREIFRVKKMNVRVEPISSEEFGAAAPRPPYSVLDCHKLTRTLGRDLPPWNESLSRYLSGSNR
ncbi:MAG TPA: dTDP-4-dehydrorhamnose reductase [Planctomycetaceae bacterium]|nr:dTDP-4-dehydrorhamnose reductase [Planctomycetaceae bacterium]